MIQEGGSAEMLPSLPPWVPVQATSPSGEETSRNEQILTEKNHQN